MHNTALMPSRLILSIALSLAFHGGAAILPDLLKRSTAAPPPPALQALLRPLPNPEPRPAEPLLKNTFDADTKEAPHATKPSPPQPQPVSRSTARREMQAAQRKLSEHLFYPSEAVAQGIEGEVRLILKLSVDSAVVDVSIAASSGYAILDNAAIKAAYRMGSLTGASSREIILPVIFRLQ